jgi:hypothetical protein
LSGGVIREQGIERDFVRLAAWPPSQS